MFSDKANKHIPTHTGVPLRKRLPILFILLTVTLDAMGIGLVLPVMPDLIGLYTEQSLANAAFWGGVLSTVYALMQFLFSPLLGNLSDRFGRRPVLLISLVAMSADYFLMALSHALWLLLLARMISGITGATHATANAFMADISTREERAKNFGLIGAGFGVGFVLGPAIGGLLGQLGPTAPFYAAGCLAALNAVFGFFVLPESLPFEKRRTFSWRESNPLSAFLKMKRLRGVGPLIVVLFIFSVAHWVYPAVWAFFTRERYGWDAQLVGASLAVFGLCMAAVQGGLVGPAMKRFGAWKLVLIGFGINIIEFTFLALNSSGILAFLFLPISALAMLSMPALNAMMANAAPDDQQGALQGVQASIAAIAAVASPLIMNNVFAWGIADTSPVYLPGAPFWVAVILCVIAALIYLRYSVREDPHADPK